jgi:soluble lytic murein transglycosylase-like protein
VIYWILAALGITAFSQGEVILEKIDENSESWTRFDGLFQKYAEKYGLKWTWLKAIALNESNLGREKSVALGLLNPNNVEQSKSYDGKSWGLMQVTLKTAKTMDSSATEAKLNNAEYSVDLAARYLAKVLLPSFSPLLLRRTEWVIKSYNQGPGNTQREIRGEHGGYANEYWDRFQRNLKRVEG